MQIGGTDIYFAVKTDKATTFRVAAQAFAELWPDAVFDLLTNDNHYEYVESFAQLPDLSPFSEIIITKDQETSNEIERVGVEPHLDDKMVHLICFDTNDFTIVIDTNKSQFLVDVVDKIKHQIGE